MQAQWRLCVVDVAKGPGTSGLLSSTSALLLSLFGVEQGSISCHLCILESRYLSAPHSPVGGGTMLDAPISKPVSHPTHPPLSTQSFSAQIPFSGTTSPGPRGAATSELWHGAVKSRAPAPPPPEEAPAAPSLPVSHQPASRSSPSRDGLGPSVPAGTLNRAI